MKKQLLIAAVAATMGTAAIADISITGSAKVNYTQTDNALSTSQDTDTFSNEMDLKVKGTNGDTAVVINFGAMDGGEGWGFKEDQIPSSSHLLHQTMGSQLRC